MVGLDMGNEFSPKTNAKTILEGLIKKNPNISVERDNIGAMKVYFQELPGQSKRFKWVCQDKNNVLIIDKVQKRGKLGRHSEINGSEETLWLRTNDDGQVNIEMSTIPIEKQKEILSIVSTGLEMFGAYFHMPSYDRRGVDRKKVSDNFHINKMKDGFALSEIQEMEDRFINTRNIVRLANNSL